MELKDGLQIDTWMSLYEEAREVSRCTVAAAEAYADEHFLERYQNRLRDRLDETVMLADGR